MSARLVLFSSSVFLPLVVLLLAAMSPPAQGATAGELLEKAIYAEETVGDLDEAIKLYEQVIAEAKTVKSAAAKAQFRLGVIYEKQGKSDAALAAFRALVENYPDEKELVAQAQQKLPSKLQLLPEPWVDGETLHMNIKLASGVGVGTMIYGVESFDHDGRDAWRCWTRGLVTLNGVDSVSWVICDKKSFAPIESLWKHSLLGEAAAEYTDNSVTLRVAGQDDPQVIEIEQPTFDNEQGVELFRRLPLKVGYKGELSIFATLGGGKVGLSVEVPELETIEVAAGKFECYKLVLNIGQTFWISNDEHRYLVRFAAGGITADLSRVEQRKSNESEELKAEGYSLTLPPGWHAYSDDGPSENGPKTKHLLDHDAIVQSTVSAGPPESLKQGEHKSAKAWTEWAVKEMEKSTTNFKLREPGIQEVKVGNRPGTTIVADFTEGGKKKTLYGVAALDAKQAFNLKFKAPAEKFDELKPQFDAIVKSLKVE
jgi:hypothetical protein